MTLQPWNNRTSAVGQVIREHRKARGLTQKQLASELGVEARTLRMYENGERALENISDLRRIAQLLKIDPVELGLAASRQPISTAAQIQAVIERIMTLLPQAFLTEARSTIDAFLGNVIRPSDRNDTSFLRALAHVYCLAGQIHAITRRTREAEHILRHFQEMQRIAQAISDQSLLALTLAYQADLLRRRGEKTQAILLLEQLEDCIPPAHTAERGLHALLLARAYASHEDYHSFQRAIANAEALTHAYTTPSPPLPLFSQGFVYEESICVYAKMGQREKSQRYLQLAEQSLPANNLCTLLLKVDRAEMLVYSGEIVQAMPLLIEVTHLAQMYNHQHLLERLHQLQYYLDDQSLLMRQASRSLGELLHGTGQY
jgi:transcriptional regulator with XRE-family HTH domain